MQLKALDETKYKSGKLPYQHINRLHVVKPTGSENVALGKTRNERRAKLCANIADPDQQMCLTQSAFQGPQCLLDVHGTKIYKSVPTNLNVYAHTNM